MKLGTPPIVLEVKKESVEFEKGIGVPYVVVDLVGEQPKLGGWSFAGTINHLEDGNLVRPLPGVTLDAKYKTAQPLCEHCGYKRRRNDSYVVRSDKGEEKQVGSGCLADFTGHLNPHDIVKAATLLAIAVEACEASKKSHGVLDPTPGAFHRGLVPYIDLKAYLSAVAATIRTHGWVSRKDAFFAKGLKAATADTAINVLFTQTIAATDEDRLLADKAVQWAENLEPQSEYEEKVKVVAGSGSGALQSSQIGVAASIVPVYRQRLKEAVLREQGGGVSRHLGLVGEHLTIALKLMAKKPVTSKYGPSLLTTWLTEDGSTVKIFASPNVGDAIEEGKTYNVGGTISKLGEWKGVKETLLKHVQILEEIGSEQSNPLFLGSRMT